MTTTQSGGSGRRKLLTNLETIEFYCLTCKGKRKIRSPKNVEIKTTKNKRTYAQAKCTAKDCTRNLVKFLSNNETKQLQELKQNKVPVSKFVKKSIKK